MIYLKTEIRLPDGLEIRMAIPYPIINDNPPRTQAIAGLNQFIYSTNWTASQESNVLVYSRTPQEPANDLLQLVPSNQYSVQFIGSENLVQVTFLANYNPPQYNIVTIVRSTPSDWLNNYNNTNFQPSMLNNDFDLLTLVDQENQLYWQNLVPRYNNSATINVPVDTILPVLKANQFWVKNSTNTAFIAVDVGNETGGGAPTNGPYITWTANSTLSEAFNIATLSPGLLAFDLDITNTFATPYSLSLPLEVEFGGTGLNSVTPYALLSCGATANSPLVPIADLGAAGQVFTSAGPGAPGSFQDIPSVTPGLANVQVFTTSGTYTPTAGASYAVVELIGGGGGSGGCAATGTGTFAISGGGGGGGYARKFITSLIPTTITIGAAGLAGISGNNNGGNGGTTSFGSVFSAAGGNGGSGSAASGNYLVNAGGTGGGATNGDVNINGSDGGNGFLTPASLTIAVNFNTGGGSYLAGAVTPSITSGVTKAGNLYGGGGAGAYLTVSSSAIAGAAGAGGICIITEYS